jgi:hypothetical protein
MARLLRMNRGQTPFDSSSLFEGATRRDQRIRKHGIIRQSATQVHLVLNASVVRDGTDPHLPL